jgi:6-phosphogluconate dehydrogenase
MQIGMIGLGRMGANMSRRLMRGGHEVAAHDRSPDAVAALVKDGAAGANSIEQLVQQCRPPRAICLMVPAAVVNSALASLAPLLSANDIVIDGGNSHYHDDIERARSLSESGIHYIDMGTSGGVWGIERGYCLMIGGEREPVQRLDPIFRTLAPGSDVAQTAGASSGGTAQLGYLHCGPAGAGHFVKMIHNGIEYGLMAAYAEGLNILRHANVGSSTPEHDAETTPLRTPQHYQYDFKLDAIA